MDARVLQRYREVFGSIDSDVFSPSPITVVPVAVQEPVDAVDIIKRGLFRPETADMVFDVFRAQHEIATDTDLPNRDNAIGAAKALTALLKMGTDALIPRQTHSTGVRLSLSGSAILDALRAAPAQ